MQQQGSSMRSTQSAMETEGKPVSKYKESGEIRQFGTDGNIKVLECRLHKKNGVQLEQISVL